jgi:hypothetical protein
MVTLDLGLPPVRGRAPLAAWLRLARNAAVHQTVVLVGSPYRLSGCAAGAVVMAGRGRGDWNSGGASHLLSGLRAWLHLVRRIGHPDRDHAMHALTLPEASFGPAVPDESTTDQKFEIRNPKSRPKGGETMSQPFEMSARNLFELAGAAFGLLLFGFCFLALAFCV